LAPVAALVGVAIWAVTFWLTRYVSVASIAAAAALPFVVLVTTWLSRTTGKLLFFSSVCLAAVVIWRHRSNISRLMHGTEPRFNRR
jgi:glycerol-3-phosphate acyltransferase PlsY